MEKEKLVQIIKDWVKVDNEMRTLQRELNIRKIEKKNTTSRVMEIMRSNNIDCFDMKDGQILYKKRNVKKPVTKLVLMEILSTYYDGDEVKAKELNNYIMENRKITVSETIVRKIQGTVSTPDPES
jgi:hypothetical protein